MGTQKLPGVRQFDGICQTPSPIDREGTRAIGRTTVKRRDSVVCLNGTQVSIQANEYCFCTPGDNEGPYTEVELGFPSVKPSDTIMPYAADPDKPTETVYGYVPVDLVRAWLAEEDAKAVQS